MDMVVIVMLPLLWKSPLSNMNITTCITTSTMAMSVEEVLPLVVAHSVGGKIRMTILMLERDAMRMALLLPPSIIATTTNSHGSTVIATAIGRVVAVKRATLTLK
jgi:hypothetical protein